MPKISLKELNEQLNLEAGEPKKISNQVAENFQQNPNSHQLQLNQSVTRKANKTDESNVKFDEDGDIVMDLPSADSINTVINFVNEERFGDPQTTKSIKAQFSKSFLNTNITPDIKDSVSVKVRDKLNIDIYLVADTNFLLTSLGTLTELKELASKYNYKIIIPSAVVHELDGLKSSSKSNSDGLSVAKLARVANKWIYNNFATLNEYVKGQKKDEVIERGLKNDDAILDCCLYFYQKRSTKSMVVLLSNDTNLCVRALKEGILTVGYNEKISAQYIAWAIYSEASHRTGVHSIDNFESHDDLSVENNDLLDAMDVDNLESPYTNLPHNPYLGQNLEIKIYKIYKDVCGLSLSIIKSFLKSVEIHTEIDEISTIKQLFYCLKDNWTALHLQSILNKVYKNEKLTRLSKFCNYSITLQTVDKCFFVIHDDSDTWRLKPSLEFIVFNEPKSLFHLKKFTKFWSVIMSKFMILSENSTEKLALEKLIGFWDDAIEHAINSNNTIKNCHAT